MNSEPKNDTICVLTGRGLDTVLQEGGSQAWILSAPRAQECEYLLCVQNRESQYGGDATADHHQAFVVGRIREVRPSTYDGCAGRWQVLFSEYAEVSVDRAWNGNRNPVRYCTLADFGLDARALVFKPMPAI